MNLVYVEEESTQREIIQDLWRIYISICICIVIYPCNYVVRWSVIVVDTIFLWCAFWMCVNRFVKAYVCFIWYFLYLCYCEEGYHFRFHCWKLSFSVLDIYKCITLFSLLKCGLDFCVCSSILSHLETHFVYKCPNETYGRYGVSLSWARLSKRHVLI